MAGRLDLHPLHLRALAVATDDLGWELEAAASLALLNHQPMRPARPEERVVRRALHRCGERKRATEITPAIHHGNLRLSSSSQQEAADRSGDGTTCHQTDLRTVHLTGRRAAELTNRLKDQLEAVHVALRQVSAARVHR